MLKEWIPLWAYPVILVFAAGTVWLRLSTVRTTYEITQIHRMIRNAESERAGLKLEVAHLRAPKRLESLARKRFGLAPPTAAQVIRMSEDEVITRVAAPGRATE